MRHAHAAYTEETVKTKTVPLSDKGIASLQEKSCIEDVIRVNPDVIYVSDFERAQQTARAVQDHLKMYL